MTNKELIKAAREFVQASLDVAAFEISENRQAESEFGGERTKYGTGLHASIDQKIDVIRQWRYLGCL